MNCIGKIFEDDNVRLYWAGGASFVIAYRSVKIGIDVYLTDAFYEKTGEFKRLTLPPCTPDELDLDYLIVSHQHEDHFDEGGVPILLEKNPAMKVLCPSVVYDTAGELGFDRTRFIKLNRGETFEEKGISIHAVTADHGDPAPDAIGVIITLGGKRIFFAGDGTYREDYLDLIGGHSGFDVMLVAINGKYGNPDSEQAAKISKMLSPKVTIPCHYWLFKEHGGDPMTFEKECIKRGLNPKLLAVGEEYIV